MTVNKSAPLISANTDRFGRRPADYANSIHNLRFVCRLRIKKLNKIISNYLYIKFSITRTEPWTKSKRIAGEFSTSTPFLAILRAVLNHWLSKVGSLWTFRKVVRCGMSTDYRLYWRWQYREITANNEVTKKQADTVLKFCHFQKVNLSSKLNKFSKKHYNNGKIHN